MRLINYFLETLLIAFVLSIIAVNLDRIGDPLMGDFIIIGSCICLAFWGIQMIFERYREEILARLSKWEARA